MSSAARHARRYPFCSRSVDGPADASSESRQNMLVDEAELAG